MGNRQTRSERRRPAFAGFVVVLAALSAASAIASVRACCLKDRVDALKERVDRIYGK